MSTISTFFRRRDNAGERGAIIVITALALLVLMAGAAMGVDIARQVSRKRSVEEIADLAAHDASYAFKPLEAQMTAADMSSWFTQYPSVPSGNFYQLAVVMAKNSLYRNTFVQLTATLSCSGTLETITDTATTNYAVMQVFVPDSNGVNQPVPCTDPPVTGVLATSSGKPITTAVTAHAALQHDFLPGQVDVRATGTQADHWAPPTQTSCVGPCTTTTCTDCSGRGEFSIGSFLARESLTQAGVTDAVTAAAASTNPAVGNAVADSTAFLNAALGLSGASALTFDAVSYQGLDNGAVTLEGLANAQSTSAANTTGRPDLLLSQSITIPALLTDIAVALTDNSVVLTNNGTSANATALTYVNQMITAVNAAGTSLPPITLGSLFAANVIASAGDAIMNASLDVSDLIGASVLEAVATAEAAVTGPQATDKNGPHFLKVALSTAGVTGLATPVPGTSSANAYLTVISAPSFAIGPVGVTTSTAQIQGVVDLTLPPVSGTTGADVLEFQLGVAKATGTLTSLACDPLLTNQAFTVAGATKGVTMTVTQPDGTSPVVANVVFADAGTVGVLGSGSASVAGSQANLAFPVSAGQFAPKYFNDMRSFSGTALGGQLSVTLKPSTTLNAVDSATMSTIITTLNSEISTVLNPPVGSTTAPVDSTTTPLAQTLGLGIAGADVTGYAPTCIS